MTRSSFTELRFIRHMLAPGETLTVHRRAPFLFRPEALVIETDDPWDLVVHDILIGQQKCLVGPGLTAAVFNLDKIAALAVTYPTVAKGVCVSVEVENRGSVPHPLSACFLGYSAEQEISPS